MTIEIVKIAKERNIPLSPLLTSLAINNHSPSDPLSIVSLACKIHNIPCIFSLPPNHTEKQILEALEYNVNIPDTAQIMVNICQTINLSDNEMLYYLEKLLMVHLDERINVFNYFGKGYDTFKVCLALLKEEDLVFYEIISVENRSSDIDIIREKLRVHV
ncbi:hypothetical protein THOM_3020 [Trachipleistophora hominis]|uniref:Uncharacterized protein n=1 Tax=Trachipleistophora hominis TaxID=72359 RepID=L7JRH1_TRAHO|nr:hypothetical protein THOM_3020 [Trachipleistophora hominis]